MGYTIYTCTQHWHVSLEFANTGGIILIITSDPESSTHHAHGQQWSWYHFPPVWTGSFKQHEQWPGT